MSTTRLWISALVLGAMSGTAASQPSPTAAPPDPNEPTNIPPVPEPDQQPTSYPAPTPQEKSMVERIGLSIAAGGGVEGFTNDSARRTTTDGGLWDVRATVGTRNFLAFEAHYIGSAQAIDALGLDRDAVLVSNGVQGNLRLNFRRERPVQPFLFAGVAWRRYDITNAATNLSDIENQDDVLEMPMGLGVAYRWRGLMLDARGEFRATTDNDLMPTLRLSDLGERAAMHRYGVQASVGYEF